MALEVIARDTETGETQTVTIEDDYVMFTHGSCYRSYLNAFSTGTHQVTVKGRKSVRRVADHQWAENPPVADPAPITA